MHIEFSLLMSVYHKDKADFLNDALQSIYDQELKPSEYVIVKDGPLSKELLNCLSSWDKKLSPKIRIISLEKNVGLAKALNVGLKECSCEYVGRMDSDDICYLDRFKLQFDFLANHPEVSLLGGWYKQYNEDMSKYLIDRKVPVHHQEIVGYGLYRTPFNHVTAVFKTVDVIAVGGYPEDIDGRMEDWWLALKLIHNNYKLHNLPRYLVKVRGGNDFIVRRGGLEYVFFEVKNLFAMKQQALIGTSVFIKNLLIKVPVRLLPNFLRKAAYMLIRNVK